MDFLKNAYNKLEDGYYAILDKIDSVVPIYKLVDPIDKLVPSFAIVLLLIVLGVLFGAATLFGVSLPGAGASLVIQVSDQDSSPLPNATVKLTYNGQSVSHPTDSLGEAKFENVPTGTSMKLDVSKNGFDSSTDTFSIQQSEKKPVKLDQTLSQSNDRTIVLVNALGQTISKAALLSFHCSNTQATAPDSKTIYNGTATVTPPKNCGTLTVSVSVEGFQLQQSISLDSDNKTIQLQENDTGKATIKIKVTDHQTGRALGGISVELFEHSLGPMDSKYSDASGIAEFKESAGTYTAKAYDLGNAYGNATSSEFTVSGTETKTVEISLEKNLTGTLKVKVVDNQTKAIVTNARVTLSKNNSKIATLTTSTANNGQVEFNISEFGSYAITVDQDSYLLDEKTITINASDAFTQFELVRFSNGVNAGTLQVAVVDQSGKGVPNAHVGLFDATTGIATGHAIRTTDVNGIARFAPTVNGRYYAFAFIGASSGSSDPSFFSIRESNSFQLNATINIPSGIVRVQVLDRDGNPLSFAKVTLFNRFNNAAVLSDFTDFNGTFETQSDDAQIRADKEVYAIVQRKAVNPGETNFADYTTAAKPVLANSVQQFTVFMQPELLQGELQIEFKGLYRGDKLATQLSPGEQYTAKFQLKIPEEKNYSLAGAHIRTGNQEIVEKDPWFLKQENVPHAAVIRGSAFDESHGEDEDMASATEGDAKWLNATFGSPNAGIYELETTIEVKNTASLQDQLALHYRAFAETQDLETIRAPVDESVRDELYAETYLQLYKVGNTTLCDVEFCFESSVFDETDRLNSNVIDTFTAKLFNPYTMGFTISNNSKTRFHNKAELRIQNSEENLLISKYTFIDAESQTRQANLNASKLPPLNMGNFTPSAKVQGTLSFKPIQSGSSTIQFQIVSDSQIVFEKSINLVNSALKELSVSYDPQTLSSGVENTLEVSVKDAATQVEVENAIVKVVDRFGTVLTQSKTTRLGKATLVIPGQSPNTKLQMRVESPDYELKQIDLLTSSGLLSFNPSQLGIALNLATRTEAQTTMQIKNVSAFPLTIESMELKGNTLGLIDTEQFNNFAQQYVGKTLNAGDDETISLQTALSNEGKLIVDRKNLKATLSISAGNFGQQWKFDVPASIAIGLGAELDDPTCLLITRKDWTAVSEGEPKSVEFEIQNNCAVNGAPVSISDLQAKASWKGNELGDLTLALYQGQKTQPVGVANLRQGFFKPVVRTLNPQSTYSAVLNFQPHGGVNGNGDVTVQLQAKNRAESKDQILENSLNAKLSVINVKECLTFSKEILFIDASQDNANGTFNISTKNCGGKVNIELDSDLELGTKNLTIQDNSSSPELQVLSNGKNLGQYPITVRAVFEGQRVGSEVKTLRARVFNKKACIQLNRYEFDVYDDPLLTDDGFDTAELSNICFEKEVKIKIVDKTSWREAFAKGAQLGLLTWGGIGLSQLGNPKTETTAAANKETEKAELNKNLLTSVGGVAFFGKASWVTAIVATVVTTLLEKNNQKEYDVAVVTRDLQIDKNGTVFQMLGDKGREGTIDPDTSVKEVGERGFNPLAGTRFFSQTIELEFNKLNQTLNGIFFRTLNVIGDKRTYDTGKEYNPGDNPSVKNHTPFDQKFHLQFDSISPDDFNITQPPLNVDCASFAPPGRNGSTGLESAPRVLFQWNWSAISTHSCDSENPNYAYCDATQFSIEVLKKLNVIQEFLELNRGSLKCPTVENALTQKTNVIGDDDIGLSSINIQKIGNDVNVLVEIQNNNNPVIPNNSITATVYDSDGNPVQTKTVSSITVTSKTKIGLLFTGLQAGAYRVTMTLSPNSTCNGCRNANSNDDVIATAFIVGPTTGLEQCEPYNVNRLAEFIDATESAGTTIDYPTGYPKDSFLKLLKFRSYLIKDAFTPDFQTDFDDYSKNIGFFQAPPYYTQTPNGLSDYFKSFTKFQFGRKNVPVAPTGYAIPGPGLYDVGFNIQFNDSSWQLFQNNSPNAKVKLELERADLPAGDSPFYFIPFNGLIGVNSPNGRVGYGVNYSGDSIQVNADLTQSVTTTDIPNSTPVQGALVKTKTSNDFKELNVTERGIVLKVERKPSELSIQFKPSYATPVLLKLTNQTGQAFAFYNFGINGADTYSGSSSNPWWGVGGSCKDFKNRLAREAWDGTLDVSGLSAKCASTQGLGSTYGVEFCDEPLPKTGNLFLKTIFYTPQTQSNNVSIVLLNDDAQFITKSELTGTPIRSKNNIPLNGLVGLEGNSPNDKLESIEQVLQLVKDRKLCVSGSGTEFWWNPRDVLNVLEKEEKAAEASCIE